MLIGCCFIPDGKDESDAKGGLEEGHPAGDSLRKKPTIPRRINQTREAAEGVRDGREVARVFIQQAVSQDDSRGGTYTIKVRGSRLHEANHQWEGPHKEFLKGGLKRPWKYQPGKVALCEIS